MRAEILRRRYLWKDKNGNVIETWAKMCHRVARVIAGVERGYGTTVEKIRSLREKFYNLISKAIFLEHVHNHLVLHDSQQVALELTLIRISRFQAVIPMFQIIIPGDDCAVDRTTAGIAFHID